jgi:putative Ca2+/H+ antiporter (TMEM165/GDT1 family)
MHALAFAVGTDIAAEIGDKSQILIFLLALRLRRPVPVILGMFVATIATHMTAGMIGLWIEKAINPDVLRWPLGILFIAVAGWTLFPQLVERFTIVARGGAFLTSAISYFIAETGGKTYIMTAALSAQTGSWTTVVLGTIIGEVAVNAPLVTLGDMVARRLAGGDLDLRWVSQMAALFLVAMGVCTMLGLPIAILR